MNWEIISQTQARVLALPLTWWVTHVMQFPEPFRASTYFSVKRTYQ